MTTLKLTTVTTAYSSGNVITRAYLWKVPEDMFGMKNLIADLTLAEEREPTISAALRDVRVSILIEMLNATGGDQFSVEEVEHSFIDHRHRSHAND